MRGPTGDQVRPLRASPLRVRPMEIGDIPRVMEIAEGLPDAPHWAVSAYRAALNPKSEPRRVALVAAAGEPDALKGGELDSGAAVGFVVASLVAGEAELESIAVAAEAQRGGVGGQILGHLLAKLREIQTIRINLEVRASNGPALALYKRHGFSETGRRVGYYADPVEDAVLMGLDLG
jgi:ribosomal-protein-alanine N-acetyltransferase